MDCTIDRWHHITVTIDRWYRITVITFKLHVGGVVHAINLCQYSTVYYLTTIFHLILILHNYKTSFGKIPSKTVYFCCMFVCLFFFFFFFLQLCLPESLTMHVRISELHAQWHWCSYFSTSFNSQRFLQFLLTVMLVAYVNSCFFL